MRVQPGVGAFGFAAMWILASLAAALICALSAVVGYTVVLAAERTRAKPRAGHAASPTPGMPARPGKPRVADDLPLWAEALNSDLGHTYEPSSTTRWVKGSAFKRRPRTRASRGFAKPAPWKRRGLGSSFSDA